MKTIIKENIIHHKGWTTDGTFNAEITPGEKIRIYGIYTNHIRGAQQFDKTFAIGDEAEFDSYNLTYTGKILSIGPNTLKIMGHGRPNQLRFHEFIRRNWDFDMDKINSHNAEESLHI